MQSLKQVILRLSKLRIIRYVAVGGTAYVFEMATLYILKSNSVSELKSVAVSFWAGLVVAFILQKTFAFQDKRRHPRILLKQSAFYLLLVALNYGFTLLVVNFASDLLGVYLIRTLVIVITTIWNFYFYKAFFTQKSEN